MNAQDVETILLFYFLLSSSSLFSTVVVVVVVVVRKMKLTMMNEWPHLDGQNRWATPTRQLRLESIPPTEHKNY